MRMSINIMRGIPCFLKKVASMCHEILQSQHIRENVEFQHHFQNYQTLKQHTGIISLWPSALAGLVPIRVWRGWDEDWHLSAGNWWPVLSEKGMSPSPNWKSLSISDLAQEWGDQGTGDRSENWCSRSGFALALPHHCDKKSAEAESSTAQS